MTSTYTPVVGTIPYRVIEHLKSRRRGFEISTPDLVEALQLETAGPLGSYLDKALRAGAVKMGYGKSALTGRRVSMWSLGDGTPLPEAPSSTDDDDTDLPARPGPSAAEVLSAWGPPRSVFDLASGSDATPKPEAGTSDPEDDPPAHEASDSVPAVGSDGYGSVAAMAARTDRITLEQLPLREPVEMVQDEDEAFVCAIWSDGRLQLQRGGQELALLSLEETRVLVSYLERMADVATA